MQLRGVIERQTYSPQQVRLILDELGIDVVSETYSDLICYCPFHSNTHTPSFTVGAENGLWFCFNSACWGNKGGNLVQLVQYRTDKTAPQAKRMIEKRGAESAVPLDSQLEKLLIKESEWPLFPQLKIDELVEQFWLNDEAQQYMYGRGFNDDTLRIFEVGWSNEQQMIVVPVHNPSGQPIGVNGRSITSKRFKLSRLPRNKVLWNVHNARKQNYVVITESQFDAMRVAQAGYPAVCPFGSHVSKEQFYLLERYFDRIVIMTDADKVGRQMGRNIAGTLRSSTVEWAVWDEGVVYPHGAKDAGDLTDDEIKQCMDNRITNFEYYQVAELLKN